MNAHQTSVPPFTSMVVLLPGNNPPFSRPRGGVWPLPFAYKFFPPALCSSLLLQYQDPSPEGLPDWLSWLYSELVLFLLPCDHAQQMRLYLSLLSEPQNWKAISLALLHNGILLTTCVLRAQVPLSQASKSAHNDNVTSKHTRARGHEAATIKFNVFLAKKKNL